jgi:two-component system alkaline phosphatase synthesis response regulator PhoP
MSAPRILVVEDEKNVGSTLVERLTAEGFEVAWATTAAEARSEITARRFDLALLDVGLPDGSGFEVAGHIRKTHAGTAILFLTALGGPEERVRGLELGAEDYIVKPFYAKELILRIHNALKRSKYLADTPDTLVLGRAQIRFDRQEAIVGGIAHTLSQKESALLKFLLERRGAIVSRDEILNFVWSDHEFPTPRTVDNFIVKLRKLVELDPENPQLIRSVRGVGYQLVLSP